MRSSRTRGDLAAAALVQFVVPVASARVTEFDRVAVLAL